MVEEPLLILSIALALHNLFLASQQIKTQGYVKEFMQSSQRQPDLLPLPEGWPGYPTCMQPYMVGSKSPGRVPGKPISTSRALNPFNPGIKFIL